MNISQPVLRERLIGLSTWRPGRLAKGALAMSVGMGLRTVVQAVVFLIVARVLGVADYGAFAAVLALSTAFGCFSGWGTQVLMVRDVSRNPLSFSAAWGRTIAGILLSSPVLFTLYMSFTWAVLPTGISLKTITIVGLADLVFAPIGLSVITAYQGCERLSRAARLLLMPILPRLAAALILLPLANVLPGTMLLEAWAVLYALAAIAGSLIAWRMVRADLGAPSRPKWREVSSALQAGWPFALGAASAKIYADIDKAMLARLGTMEAAGAYSAGYRVADLATVPVLSLISAAMPRFFRAGENGAYAALSFACRVVPVPLAYCIFAGIGLYLSAGILPLLLGAGYMDSVPTLQWLAWIPAISLPRLLLQSLLIGGDRQKFAVNILGAGGILNIALNLWLIPLWSWRGAVVATYAAEIAMAMTMGAVALFPWFRHRMTFSGN